jgi:hypothetical protein
VLPQLSLHPHGGWWEEEDERELQDGRVQVQAGDDAREGGRVAEEGEGVVGVGARRSETPVVFFLLQAVGVAVQRGLGLLLRRLFVLVRRSSATTPPTKPVAFPRWLRRAGNLLFTLAWLHFTGWGLIDDMSRAGIWLFEPVPVSPLRMMGLGVPGEKWWRWEGGYYGFGWYKGNTWWESGLRL